MAYVINRWNGAILTSVEDGTVDQTLDIKLIGKNYAGYGEIQNETFVHMLENFANASPPPNAIAGQIWFDSQSKRLKFYAGEQVAGQKLWKTAGGIEYGLEPLNASPGDIWYDTSVGQLKVKDPAGWVTIGPESGGPEFGITRMVGKKLRTTDGSYRAVVAAYVDEDCVFIISKAEFDIDVLDIDSRIPGFNQAPYNKIKQGITLPFVNSQGISTSAHVYWGTSSNSVLLNGKEASQYLQIGQLPPGQLRFGDQGYTVGEDNELRVFIENGTEPVFQNQSGANLHFRVQDGVTTKNPLQVTGAGVIPGTSLAFSLGSSTRRWSTVWANAFDGTATQANALNVGGVYRTASVASSANTIAVRDGESNITANLFMGTANEAKYADLAEKYLTDAEYEPGTVVAVGGSAEVRMAINGDRALGVVSTNPAYMMNSDLEDGTYVALKGRVPCKVIGKVKKGDRLISTNGGCATTAAFHQYSEVFGIALESSDDEEVKVIEVVVL